MLKEKCASFNKRFHTASCGGSTDKLEVVVSVQF